MTNISHDVLQEVSTAEHSDDATQNMRYSNMKSYHNNDAIVFDDNYPKHAKQRYCRPWPLWCYGVLFVINTVVSVLIVERGVSSFAMKLGLPSPALAVWDFVSKSWRDLNFVFLLNFALVALLYLILWSLTNRFWLATCIFFFLTGFIAIAENAKIEARYEAIYPADITAMGKNVLKTVDFLPPSAMKYSIIFLLGMVGIIAFSVVFSRLDASHGRLVRFRSSRIRIGTSIVVGVCSLTLFSAYAATVGTVDSWSNKLAYALGDTPSQWDSVYDAQRNGPLVSFLRQLNPKIMTKPNDYNEQTLIQLAKKYSKEADIINASRDRYLTDSTVIYVLSESLSDPARVPGVVLNKDPLPNIRNIKKTTDSGFMLSSGYGGGTANLEYMSLTGLSMANFDPSLTSPYQQLVPNAHWVNTINQMWGSAKNSIAFHPYEPSVYARASNYPKFGFSHLYTLQKPDIIAHQDKLSKSPYVSDEAAYKSALEKISVTNDNQFVHIITMQNHMPYFGWYDNNEFTVTSSDPKKPLGDSEKEAIATYAKGEEYTDMATQDFLNKLNELNKPITVVFYGDHLPGIYTTAGADPKNSLDLHLTDYFIWSNKASHINTSAKQNQYSSPNFFIAQAAEHMNARVSPFVAFLTRLHEKIAALEPPVVNHIQGWSRIPEGENIYLDSNGMPKPMSDWDKETKQLMHDYKLIQYDMTAGKGYLSKLNFVTVPRR